MALRRQAGRLLPVTGGAPQQNLLAALEALRERLAGVRFGLETETGAADRGSRSEMLAQLDDYVLPRFRRLDAPLLAVVGGSTGAGKSTLVNTLVGSMVSETGVLRPTTRAPLLAHHPADARWFADRRILPGLVRSSGAGTDPRMLGLVSADSVPRGLALLDAPDIDSVVRENRELAAELLAAADLWLFVTSAARYADAVPWGFLAEAAQRSAAVAVVLDRTPPAAAAEIGEHLARMLHDHDLKDAPLFLVPETYVKGGLLPQAAVEPVREWLRELAADADSRQAVVRRTLTGVVQSYHSRVPVLVERLEAQEQARAALRDAVRRAYDRAGTEVDEAVRDGSVLRGEVLARWQELVGTGQLLNVLQTRIGRWRDRFAAAVTGRPPAGEQLRVALEHGVAVVIREAAAGAAESTALQWRQLPGGVALLAPELESPSADFAERTGAAVSEWQRGILDLIRTEGHGRRSTARIVSYGVNGAGLLVMLAVFAHTGGLTGGELVVAGGASALSQKLLEALLGDQAVRNLAATARADLIRRVSALFDAERERFTDQLVRAGDGDADAGSLRAAWKAVEAAR